MNPVHFPAIANHLIAVVPGYEVDPNYPPQCLRLHAPDGEVTGRTTADGVLFILSGEAISSATDICRRMTNVELSSNDPDNGAPADLVFIGGPDANAKGSCALAFKCVYLPRKGADLLRL